MAVRHGGWLLADSGGRRHARRVHWGRGPPARCHRRPTANVRTWAGGDWRHRRRWRHWWRHCTCCKTATQFSCTTHLHYAAPRPGLAAAPACVELWNSRLLAFPIFLPPSLPWALLFIDSFHWGLALTSIVKGVRRVVCRQQTHSSDSRLVQVTSRHLQAPALAARFFFSRCLPFSPPAPAVPPGATVPGRVKYLNANFSNFTTPAEYQLP